MLRCKPELTDFGPSYRRRAFHEAQQVARRHIAPWLKPEQEEAEKEYRCVAFAVRGDGQRVSEEIDECRRSRAGAHAPRPGP